MSRRSVPGPPGRDERWEYGGRLGAPTLAVPRVVLVGNLAQLTGGVTEFQLSATSVKQLFQQLAELYPAIGRHLDEGVAVAIDGQIYQDALLEPIGPDSEVFLLPQIAGGSSDGTEGLLRLTGEPVRRGWPAPCAGRRRRSGRRRCPA